MDYNINYTKIVRVIRNAIQNGKDKFVIYPFGENGLLTKNILNYQFGVDECFLIDNYIYKNNKDVKHITFLNDLDVKPYTFLLTSENIEHYEDIRKNLVKYVPIENIIDIFQKDKKSLREYLSKTKCGKYSYGPLCNHWLVDRVGAFCSFAIGTDVVENHATEYISTSPFLYLDNEINNIYPLKYEENVDQDWFFSDVKPKGLVPRMKKISIGNDVWMGKNVTITNGANIGDGVIAGAGSVITKDIEDYAIVVGVPARVIRLRYTKQQIKFLKKIAWWNWSDEKIRKYYNDFYEDIDVFIEKHNK